jgi:ABC-type sugar transport system permease subunit
VTATISTTSVTPTRRRRRSARLSPLLVAFVLVPFAVESVWVFWPAIQGFWFSLTRWDGMTPPTFVGTDNYVELAVILGYLVRAFREEAS